MDNQFGSGLLLIDSSDGYLTKVKVDEQRSVKKTIKTDRRRADKLTAQKEIRSEICETVKLCYHVSMSLLLISITVIVCVYISHLQDHVQSLDARVRGQEARIRTLEKTLADVTLHQDKSSKDLPGVSDSALDVRRRARRDANGQTNPHSQLNLDRDLPNESVHHRRHHHGIGVQNIAYIWANSQMIRNATRDTQDFTRYNYMDDLCAKLYENVDGQFLCTATQARDVDLYMTSNQSLHFTRLEQKTGGCEPGVLMINGAKDLVLCMKGNHSQKDTLMTLRNNRQFRYFSEAHWMRDEQNFILNRETGELRVIQPGIYIIHSNIHFTDKTEEPHYGVYREGVDGEKTLLSRCQISEADKEDGTSVFPCPTWQLMPLNAGDQIYMQIAGYNWFRVERETFHLALIRLNDWH